MSALTGFRISPQQARAWRDAQHGAPSHAGSRLVIDVARAPSTAEIEARLSDLAQREEILRTALHAVPGMALPIQVIEDQPRVTFAAEDWRGFDVAQRDARLAEATLAPGSVLSVRDVRIAEERWLLCLEGAANALDLASLALIAAELLGAPVEERLQYVDYAEWKNGLLEDEADSQAVRFWQQARTENAPLELHGLQAASAANCQPALRELGGVPPRSELQRVATQAGLRLDELLFAAWCVLLARLSGQQRIQLGWHDSGRGEGLEQALGLFEQFLPVQAEVDLQAPLAPQATALLGPLRQARGWRDHYDSAQACALYFAWRELDLPAQLGTAVAASGFNAPFALGLECRTIIDATLELRLAYDQARFDANAIACLEEQWTLLLQGLCADGQALGALPLLGPRQEQELRAGIAPVEVRDVGVLALIEERALANPDAPALADGSGVTGYGELLAQVDALARRLRVEGVQAGDVVGILMRRERQAIVAMLAALKVGAAYLPLDPAYPDERLSYMLANSAARLLLSTSELQDSVASNVPTLLLDAVGEVADANMALPSVAGEQTAYLIYTSGSSGQPKGVPISHAALSRSTQVRMAFYREPVRAYLLLSSLSFDSSVAGIYWTLCQGGLLVLPASGEELDLEVLGGLIERHRVSHGLSLPSLYETLLDYSPPATLAHLRTWIVAGEPCTPRVLDKHRGKAAQAQLVNEYGPTEATVWATAEVLSDAAPDERAISIGRPIPGMGLWLLNEHGQPAAIGEPGEIHLGGPTLASGYLDLPEQTASAFVHYPHIAQGQRLYRTGDLARRRVDGRLDFLGRRDQQIKIRGHRVERGEIERVLQSHSEVREAVVVAQQHEGSARLIAYFTDRHGYVPEAQALSSFLHDRLPSYMVPAAFVHLAALPHTPNGKLDLNALPDPDRLVAASAAYVAPRNELEAALADICQQVLKRERIGVQDNFFQIGGDSILSLQIVSRANQQGIRLSAKQIFESETIERMAQVATRGVPASEAPAVCAAAPEDARTARTAADFPLAALDDEAFGDLLAELNATD
ncbi:non-ribosomal peptide synthetase [Pseudomonas indica]|uniref:Amino acid adenylation domain-containing protein n=1 Tax=Pseudomonas indica TaxID=137658 RepID=A0A1G9A0Z5_9PSED|nr:amino acid adenylation domain-containing protein [Pseudomonas indica]SDK20931.1 amino acid adenylation domain-containing protein [Pseudomonas indica]